MSTTLEYFVDTSFWVSLLEVGDDHHERALAWQRHVVRDRVGLITTEPVLWEVLNFFSNPAVRQRGLGLYEAAHRRPEISVEGFDPALCDAAIKLYSDRPDKEWGVVDCFSFCVMGLRGLAHALTADHHFEQAGFVALLLQDPPQ